MSRRSFLAGAAALVGVGALGAAGCGIEAAAQRARPFYYDPRRLGPRRDVAADVCVYGATSGGVMASIAAARRGQRTVLLAFGEHIGGMTCSGVSATDTGDARTITGLAGAFYRAVGAQYGSTRAVYNFEPKVATRVMQSMLAASGVTVLTGQPLAGVVQHGTRIVSLRAKTGTTVSAPLYIDASYEGDLMAAAGVEHLVGREANKTYAETLNGIRPAPKGNGFKVYVSAYQDRSRFGPTLLPGVSGQDPGTPGSGDTSVMAYGFRPTITTAPGALRFPKPPGYRSEEFELVAQSVADGEWDIFDFRVALPGSKYDLNASGGVSTDAIGMSGSWAEASFLERQKIFDAHLRYDEGLLWFVAHDPAIAPRIRASAARFGLPSDEFITSGGWPPDLYVREARRMVSDYVMSEWDCVGGHAALDPIALASYKIDSHPCRRLAVGGIITNEGTISHDLPRPYGISLRSILPRADQCSNLLVSTSVASSHVAWSSLRMEPVFMMLGEASGTVASLAAEGRAAAHDVPYDHIRYQLTSSGLAIDPTSFESRTRVDGRDP